MTIVVVPHRPGPLIEPSAERPRDDVEPAGMGIFDIVLAVIGGALLVTVLTTDLPLWLTTVAVAFLALGLGLPAHAAWSRVIRDRRSRRESSGRPLNVTHATTRRLVAAYGRLEESCRRQKNRTGSRAAALAAAHLAVTEVARLLHDGAPGNPYEEEYVTRRAEAISALADRLAQVPSGRHDIMPPTEPAGSLARIEALMRRLGA